MLSAALSAGMAWRTKAWDRRRLVDVVPGCQGFRGKGAALVVVGWFGMVHARNPICKCSSWGFCRSLRLHDPPVISSAEERYQVPGCDGHPCFWILLCVSRGLRRTVDLPSSGVRVGPCLYSLVYRALYRACLVSWFNRTVILSIPFPSFLPCIVSPAASNCMPGTVCRASAYGNLDGVRYPSLTYNTCLQPDTSGFLNLHRIGGK
jgi:hypothetical protein